MENIIEKYLDFWLKIKAGRSTINCTYFSNKIRNGIVIIPGFMGGKGDFDDIRKELKKVISINPSFRSKQDIVKLARKNRIGIDCSGFVYRFLAELVRLKYQNCEVLSLEQVFPDGIYRTNADKLTLGTHVIKINLFLQVRLGDLIRINNGRHVAVVVKNNNNMITYIHSSKMTKESGVHTGIIMVDDFNNNLKWRETTKNDINFGVKYFHPQNGDGIFRLKIFNP